MTPTRRRDRRATRASADPIALNRHTPHPQTPTKQVLTQPPHPTNTNTNHLTGEERDAGLAAAPRREAHGGALPAGGRVGAALGRRHVLLPQGT